MNMDRRHPPDRKPAAGGERVSPCNGFECTSSDTPCSCCPEAPAFEMGSLIGFTGAKMRGGLAFVAPAELVARTLPVPKVESRGRNASSADLERRDRQSARGPPERSPRASTSTWAPHSLSRGRAFASRRARRRGGLARLHDRVHLAAGLPRIRVPRGETRARAQRGWPVIPEGDVVIFVNETGAEPSVTASTDHRHRRRIDRPLCKQVAIVLGGAGTRSSKPRTEWRARPHPADAHGVSRASATSTCRR